VSSTEAALLTAESRLAWESSHAAAHAAHGGRSELETAVGTGSIPVSSDDSTASFLGDLTGIVDGVLAVVGLAEHNLVALLLTSDDELANSVTAGSEDTVLVIAEVELHVLLLAALLVPTFPDFLGVHLKSESVRHALEVPFTLDGTTIDSSGVVDRVLALILLDKADVAVRSNLSGESELSDFVAAATNDTSADVDLKVVEAHVVLGSTLSVVSLPADNLVWHLTP
jgi:hypothetical protein